ncbi:MAG: TonB-dependent receptor domain-containing protein [Asticcacaulis sp.]
MARAQGCVPINVFDGYNKEEQKYLLVSAGTRGESRLENAQAILSGTLFELPAGPLKGAFGLESRRVTGFLDYANDINQGITTGNQIGDNDRTSFLTNEVFTELSVPVLKDLAFAKELNIEGAFRRSDSSRFGEYDTWKIGGDWSPLAGLRFRVTKAKSVRTPNLSEVTGISQTFGIVNDPCVNYGTSSNATLKANCAAAGIPANYDPPQVVQQSVSGLVGGNDKLKPEEAETLTLGVVFNGSQFEAAPSWLAPLTVTLDRFKIDTTNLINTIGRQEIADLCYTTAGAGRDFYCAKLQRGANVAVPGANYVLSSVDDQLQNLASLEIAGYDFEAGYSARVADIIPGADLGRLSVTSTWTFYDKASRVPLPGAKSIDMLGAAGGSTSDQGWIKRQGTTAFNWSLDKVKVNWTTRFIGEAKSSPTAANAVTIKAHVYHDMQVRYAFGEQLEVYGGVSNVFDKKPPFFPFGQSGTQALDTVPAYYDVFGRSAYVGFKSRF